MCREDTVDLNRELGAVTVDDLNVCYIRTGTPLRCRSLVCTEAGSTALLKFTSYV